MVLSTSSECSSSLDLWLLQILLHVHSVSSSVVAVAIDPWAPFVSPPAFHSNNTLPVWVRCCQAWPHLLSSTRSDMTGVSTLPDMQKQQKAEPNQQTGILFSTVWPNILSRKGNKRWCFSHFSNKNVNSKCLGVVRQIVRLVSMTTPVNGVGGAAFYISQADWLIQHKESERASVLNVYR